MADPAQPTQTTPPDHRPGGRDSTADVELLEDILHSVWLHGRWRHLTRQMTTEEKNRFADAVEAASRRLIGDEDLHVDRWWNPEHDPGADTT